MKKVSLLIMTSVVLLNSCGSGGDKKSGEKGKWAQDERKEFMSSCISSARKTYEQRGMQPDSAVITCMCQFSGKIIEEKYAYADANKVSSDEVKEIMESAAKSCLPKN
ncbi:hypothetical protein ACTJIJ_10525 [Niabella sp. 22666]|uniref:hypothetical protein n=1 Tax=Niabella sp. 22666 TaxID=3453954 RepID=UPI003F8346C3